MSAPTGLDVWAGYAKCRVCGEGFDTDLERLEHEADECLIDHNAMEDSTPIEFPLTADDDEPRP